jgi:hypothetical protein
MRWFQLSTCLTLLSIALYSFFFFFVIYGNLLQIKVKFVGTRPTAPALVKHVSKTRETVFFFSGILFPVQASAPLRFSPLHGLNVVAIH